MFEEVTMSGTQELELYQCLIMKLQLRHLDLVAQIGTLCGFSRMIQLVWKKNLQDSSMERKT
jgi:xanthine/uracil/vitamin C permease (AzgA family)